MNTTPSMLLVGLVSHVLLVVACSDTGLTALPSEEVPPTEEEDEDIPVNIPTGSVIVTLCAGEDDPEIQRSDVAVWIAHDFGRTTARTDAEGRALLEPVPSGVWLVEAARAGRRASAEVQVFPAQQAEVDLDDCLPPPPTTILAHTATTLVKVNLDGGTTPRGSFEETSESRPSITDIAVEADEGEAFAVTANGRLFRLDASNAALSSPCAVPMGANALAWSGDGRLVLGAGPELYVVEPDTCTSELVATLRGGSSDGDIAPAGTGRVYWAVTGRRVVEVDLASGAITDVGSPIDSTWGMSSVEGELLGFAPSGDVFTIPTDGSDASVLFGTRYGWWGAAAGPLAE